MAVQAAIDSVVFTALLSPGPEEEGYFQLGANVKYFDGVGGTATAGIGVNVPIGGDAGGINNELVNEAIRLAPAGYESITAQFILIPVYTSGAQPGLIE